ncbi:MAG TPA: flagellar basal-body MS-ring/collar protein FliF [Acidobacteriota bacterium]|nr:flagellar basal-body MS-ring/collar protein FliF [Acidobacteriota bacterium]
MSNTLTQFRDLWNRFSPVQRFIIIGAALATLGLIGGLVYFNSQPEYGVLFSDLRSSDAQAMVEKLKAAGIPYRLSNGGSTILVPAEQVNESRLQMAGSGMLSNGHVGFDLFDKNSFGMTDFTQQVNYQRALEGELSRTIESMAEVQSVRVHITQSRESLFTEKSEPAKAAVLLTLKRPDIPQERVESIVNLISGSVEGLTPDNVSVTDARGRLLAGGQQDSLKGVNKLDSLLAVRRKFEAETGARVVELLEPLVGTGHVRANVSAEIDFSEVEETQEQYDPKSQVIRMQQLAQEYRNKTGGPSGVVGTRANDPTLPAITTTVDPTKLDPAAPPTDPTKPLVTGVGDERITSTTTYEIDKTARHTIGAGGTLTRLSVSVLLDDPTGPEAVKRTTQDQEKIQGLVAAAVGINTGRGDQIVVHMIPFQREPVETAPVRWWERNQELTRYLIKYGSLALLALFIILLVIRPALRLLRSSPVPARSQTLLPEAQQLALAEGKTIESHTEVSQALAALSEEPRALLETSEPVAIAKPKTVAQMEAEIEMELDSKLPNLQGARSTLLRKRLIEQGQKEPQKLAQTLRGWLQEEPETPHRQKFSEI